MNETVTAWTQLMQVLTRSVLRCNPHLMARPHQTGWMVSPKDPEAWQALPCHYGKGCRQGRGSESPDTGMA